jgi:hypothetical protein
MFHYPNKSSTKIALFWNCSEPNLTKHLSNLMLYSTNPQTNLIHQVVLRKEWDHQVWGQSNHVWVTNHRLEDNRCCVMNFGQISRSFFFFASLIVVCVLHSLIHCIVVAFLLRMEARVFLTCFSVNNFNRWSRHQLDDAQALDLWAIFVGHKVYSMWGDHSI